MVNTSETTRVDIVLTGLPDTKCFTSWQEFLQSLPDLISVAIPNNITNVIVSNVQPSSSQTTDVWFRLSNSGSFLSINVFSQGAWRVIYPVNVDSPVPTTQIFQLFGDSTQPPAGFANTDDVPELSPGAKTALKATWLLEGTIFTIYTACFVGF